MWVTPLEFNPRFFHVLLMGASYSHLTNTTLFTLIVKLFLQVDVPSNFVGLVLDNCNLPYANHGRIISGDPSPILFFPISSTKVRCLVGNGDMARFLKTMVTPQVQKIILNLLFSSYIYFVFYFLSITIVSGSFGAVLFFCRSN